MNDAGFTTGRLLAFYDRICEAPDAIARLRRFVLDLAVRGKLVEQDPADEPPTWIPTTVTTDKERNVRSRLEPDLAEHPFDIPKAWRWVRIGDQLELLNGMAFKPSDWGSTGLRIVRIQNLNNADAPFNYCEPERARERSLIDDGAFLISWSGTPGTSFGAFIWDRGPAVLNQHIFRCDFRTGAFTPQYLRLAINGRLDEMIDKAHGGVGLRHITKGKLEAMLIGLPPIAEQCRITERFDELMALCERLEEEQTRRETLRDRLTTASLARLTAPEAAGEAFKSHARFAFDNLPTLTARPDQIKTLRQTILNLAVRGKLVEQNPADEPASELLKRIRAEKAGLDKGKKRKRKTEIEPVQTGELPFSMPAGWHSARIQDLLIGIQTGPFGSSLHQSDYQVGGTPVINPASIQNGRIVPIEKMAIGPKTLDRLATFKLRTSDIVMARRGEMGRCAIVTPVEDGWLCGTGSLTLRPSKLIFARFLVLLIGSPFGRTYLGGTAVGSTMQNLNQSILLNLPFGLPPFAEQCRIVAKVDDLMALCSSLEASLTTAGTTRDRLLDALLHEALAPAAGTQEAAE